VGLAIIILNRKSDRAQFQGEDRASAGVMKKGTGDELFLEAVFAGC